MVGGLEAHFDFDPFFFHHHVLFMRTLQVHIKISLLICLLKEEDFKGQRTIEA